MTTFEKQPGLAGVVILIFALAYGVLITVQPASGFQLSHSDPLVQLANALVGLKLLPVICAIPAILWLAIHRPDAGNAKKAALLALVAVIIVGAGVPLLRLITGPQLPAFIPPEESAQPGMALGVGAALLEEGIFRIGLLATFYLLLSRKMTPLMAGILSAVIMSLILAAMHEVGPGAHGFDIGHFMARFVILGLVMSALFLRIGPAFLVTAHCTAHVMIPLFFPGGSG